MQWFSVAVFLALGLLIWLWRFGRAGSMVDRWAERNGYRLIASEYRTLWQGPFFWPHSKGQMVYHVTVETPDGQQRHGFVRVGGWLTGLLSDRVDVRWED